MQKSPIETERRQRFMQCSVYPVVTAAFCPDGNPLKIAEELLKGGAGVIQIREKEMADAPYLELLRAARALTNAYHALLIADDRLDAALIAGADGVHLGQDDLPCADARRLAPDLLIGVSTHNREELLKAQADGCSYLNIGPIFPTGTKSLPMNPLGTALLASLIPEVHVPFSVMGGIKYTHLAELSRLGCRHVAAVTAFSLAESPAEEVRRWTSAIHN